MAVVVWMVFGPFGSFWLYLFGWAVVLAAADGVLRLVRRRGVPSPGHLVAGLLRLGPESWLVAPRWAKVRLAAVGCLVFASMAGVMGWEAGREYRVLGDLREHGIRTEATVVAITGRSEEGRVTSVSVRFGTASGSVRADVDGVAGSTSAAQPGALLPVIYDPERPTEVRHVAYLDGGDADGARLGAILIGVLAAGFLVGVVREVRRGRRRNDLGEGSGSQNPEA
ncbi:DUF3592 domain-containing protein [Streptomyces sp. NPDC014940]|uniref:DUF3592 domain-containing protein n=1 Tax=Streptomyces sp. NPDC014940 TaxID=3364932 RepID=UPI003701F73F